MKADVTSVTLADSSTQTIQTYTSSYNDQTINTKASYPILIVNQVTINWEDFTLTKKQAKGFVDIDIFCTKSESSNLFIDKITDTIETHRAELRALGLKEVNLDLVSYYNFVDRGAISVHMGTARFSFKISFNKTITW